jgi:cell wall-associated NlpC family hydrolase
MSYQSVLARVGEIQSQLAAYAPAELPAPTTDAAGQSFQTMLDSSFGTAPPPPGTSTASGLGEPSPYDADIVAAATANGVSPALVKAVVRAESGFDPNAVSRAGAQGLMQLMPSTAAGLGVTDPFDPKQNLMGGAKFLRQLLDRFGGDPSKALAGYNAGPGAVEKYGGIPPYEETQAYVPKVLGYVEEYGGLNATGAATAGTQSTLAAAAITTSTGIPAGYALVPLTALGITTPATAIAPTATTTTLPTPDSALPTGTQGAQALSIARQFLGTPYRWGGESPATGFDCSGLLQYSFKQLGVDIPRVSQDQFRSGAPVPKEALQPGDLVFFQRGGDVHHVGMYVGNGQFLHAPHTGDVVKISSLSEPHYAAEYCGARRYGR